MIILSNEFTEVYDPYEAESVTWPINLLKACNQGKGGGGSPPPAPRPPDPVATAQAQGAANREAAIASAELAMVDQFSPYGNLVYTGRGTSAEGTPQYTATQTLAPAQQTMLDLSNLAGINYGTTANRQLQAVSDRLSVPVDYTQFGAAPTVNEATRQNVFTGIQERARPWQTRQLDALEGRLTNQGINIGTDAWNTEMDRYQTGINDFNLAADASALNQMSALYQLEGSQRDRAINELIQQRTQPLNELSAMLSGTAVQRPSFVPAPAPQVQPGDLQGATYANYQGALNNYNQAFGANLAMQQGLQGGLFGLGAAGLGAYGMSQYGGGR